MVSDRKLEKTKLKLEALYKEYGTRTKEIELFSGRYHRNVGYVQTYLTALSSLSIYIYFKEAKFFKEALVENGGYHHFEIIVVLSFLTLFLFFLHASMMDSLYMLMANGSRVGVIEKEVNETIKTSAMEWENKVMPFILTDQWWVVNGALRPQPLIFIWMSLLFMLAISSLCYFSYQYARSYFGIYAVLTILFSLFHLWQWVQLSLLSGGAFIKNSIFHIFGLEDLKQWDTDIICYAIAPLTVFLGFGVFAIAALQTNTFFPNEHHPFVLLAIPSIWIGDLFILPFLNRKIYDLIKSYKPSWFIITMAIIIAFTVMGYLHYTWTQDAYTGFMDRELGHLSFAGWWHYLFASVEFAAILIAVYIGVVSIYRKNISLIAQFTTFSGWLFRFTALSILDFLWRPLAIVIPQYIASLGGFIISGCHYFDELVKQFHQDWIALVPFVLTTIMSIYCLKINSQQINKKGTQPNDSQAL